MITTLPSAVTMFAMAFYASISVLGYGVRKVRREASTAGVMGLLLTIVHGLSTLENCPFEIVNAWMSAFVLGVFVVIDMFRRDKPVVQEAS